MTDPTPRFALGIDIAKDKFDVALITADGRPKTGVFANDTAGFEKLVAWLTKQFATDPTVIAAGLEATGSLGDALAHFLHGRGYRVSVINPAAISAFAKSRLVRNKTDKADAELIARFLLACSPARWTPPPAEIVHLQALSRRLASLQEMKQMEENRLQTLSPVQSVPAVQQSLTAIVAALEEQIVLLQDEIKRYSEDTPEVKKQKDLLTSIPGIGEVTARTLLSEMPDLSRFTSASALVAYAGLSPRQGQSGSSVRHKTRLCKVGSGRLRKALFFPAMSGLDHNPLWKAMRERLLARGKAKMCVIGVAMRKMLTLVFSILKSGKPFDRNHTTPATSPA
jgi:transposase